MQSRLFDFDDDFMMAVILMMTIYDGDIDGDYMMMILMMMMMMMRTQIQNPDKTSRATDPMRRKQQKMIPISWKTIQGIRNPGLS